MENSMEAPQKTKNRTIKWPRKSTPGHIFWKKNQKTPLIWKDICTPMHSSIIYNCQYMEATWPPHAKSWVIGKDPDAGRDWGQAEKGTTEDEMAGWHHWLDAHEFEWTPGVGDGQGGLACCNSWGCKELDTAERLNWTELMSYFSSIDNRFFPNIILFIPVILLNIFPTKKHSFHILPTCFQMT